MTPKRPSKVREAKPVERAPEPTPDLTPQQVIDAMDTMSSVPPEPGTTEWLEQNNKADRGVPDDDFDLQAGGLGLSLDEVRERYPTLRSRPEPEDPQAAEWDESERIRRRIDESPELRGFIARYMASIGAITRENGGVAPVMVLPEQDPQTEVMPPTGVFGLLRLELEPLWCERLDKMATLAGMTPHAYLETLLRRAWCAMPRSARS